MRTPAAKTIGRKGNWAALMLSVLLLVVSLHRAEAGVNAWTTNGPHSETINALAIDPQTPAILYAGGTDAVFKSTDGGGSWHSTGLTKPGVVFISALAIDPQAPATLYAGTYSSGVFKSTDAGVTWGAVNTGLTSLYVRALVTSPLTPTTLYRHHEVFLSRVVDGRRRLQEHRRRGELEHRQYRIARARCRRPGHRS